MGKVKIENELIETLYNLSARIYLKFIKDNENDSFSFFCVNLKEIYDESKNANIDSLLSYFNDNKDVFNKKNLSGKYNLDESGTNDLEDFYNRNIISLKLDYLIMEINYYSSND